MLNAQDTLTKHISFVDKPNDLRAFVSPVYTIMLLFCVSQVHFASKDSIRFLFFLSCRSF